MIGSPRRIVIIRREGEVIANPLMMRLPPANSNLINSSFINAAPPANVGNLSSKVLVLSGRDMDGTSVVILLRSKAQEWHDTLRVLGPSGLLVDPSSSYASRELQWRKHLCARALEAALFGICTSIAAPVRPTLRIMDDDSTPEREETISPAIPSLIRLAQSGRPQTSPLPVPERISSIKTSGRLYRARSFTVPSSSNTQPIKVQAGERPISVDGASCLSDSTTSSIRQTSLNAEQALPVDRLDRLLELMAQYEPNGQACDPEYDVDGLFGSVQERVFGLDRAAKISNISL